AGRWPLAEAIGARNLVIIIVTMPLFFLIVVMATISIFGRPGEKQAMREAAPIASAGPARALRQPAVRQAISPTFASAPAPIILPPGAKISAMALDGDRLAMRIEGSEGGEIVIYNLVQGAVIERVAVRAGAPDQ
ncbi:MAG TPA: hypothetical protein VNH64_11145, partial [Parvularculaceae bacterium]|nr:hypothetical protein [Parvularculaceae bacterium]